MFASFSLTWFIVGMLVAMFVVPVVLRLIGR